MGLDLTKKSSVSHLYLSFVERVGRDADSLAREGKFDGKSFAALRKDLLNDGEEYRSLIQAWRSNKELPLAEQKTYKEIAMKFDSSKISDAELFRDTVVVWYKHYLLSHKDNLKSFLDIMSPWYLNRISSGLFTIRRKVNEK